MHCMMQVLPDMNIYASVWDMVGLHAAVQLSIEIMMVFKLYSVFHSYAVSVIKYE